MILKRRIQWINSLPEEIRQRAISRIQEQLICPDWHEEFCSLELCLKSSFIFAETKEGKELWQFVAIWGTDKINVLNPTKRFTYA